MIFQHLKAVFDAAIKFVVYFLDQCFILSIKPHGVTKAIRSFGKGNRSTHLFLYLFFFSPGLHGLSRNLTTLFYINSFWFLIWFTWIVRKLDTLFFISTPFCFLVFYHLSIEGYIFYWRLNMRELNSHIPVCERGFLVLLRS